MDNYITLNQLKQTTQSLLLKINDNKDYSDNQDTSIKNRVSTLENAEYQTSAQVNSAIASAIDQSLSNVDLSKYLQKEITNSENDSFMIELSGNGTTTAGLYTTFLYNNGTQAATPFEITGDGTTGKVSVKISDLVTPTYATDAANKQYVDDMVAAGGGGSTSITNTLTSGTRIATINGTDIYAPEGGGVVTETDPVFSASAAAGITTEKISAWDAKSNFSGSYNDLSDKPTIPTVPTNVSAFTNDAGYLTSYTETDPTVPSWAKASTKPTYTASEVGAATSSHVHGNVKNDGTITVNTSMANGDRLLFSDTSDSSKIKSTSITIGTSTTQYLANNGTWQNLPTVSVSQTLTSGTEIGSVNSTKLYAPTPYDDSALAARVTALEQLEWATYYSGRSNPSNSQGQNGDIYLQY